MMGRKEKTLNHDAIGTKASARPLGGSEAGMVIPNCPELGQVG